MAYQRILVAIDLTDEADEVVAAATSYKDLHGDAELHLISVVKPLNYALGGYDASGIAAVAEIEPAIRKATKEAMKSRAKTLGIPESSTHVKTGKPATEIKTAAEELQADLIIIGTHGRHGLGLLLGSTANGVLHGVACDVLTVRIH